MSYFVIIKEKVLNILWCVCKQTSSELCIKVVILMKLECKIVLRCIRNVILNVYSKGHVCATIWREVASRPIIHRSADRCQLCQIHYSRTVTTKLFSP